MSAFQACLLVLDIAHVDFVMWCCGKGFSGLRGSCIVQWCIQVESAVCRNGGLLNKLFAAAYYAIGALYGTLLGMWYGCTKPLTNPAESKG